MHNDIIVIDGLIISKWERSTFEDMRRGGITAANCTVSVWEGFQDTMNNIAEMQKYILDNSDILMQVNTTADIKKAKQENKTGIILGFQNAHAYEDKLGYIDLFKQVGVGIVQMAYNTQNLICTGCYEKDKGLSDYGREVVAEMNRVGVLCDLSHVGRNSARDIIECSKQPVCYSHCLPAGLKEHPRNKSDEDLKFIADRNGFVGVTMFPPFLPKGVDSTVDDYVAAIDYIINIVGEERVGVGTDFTQGYDRPFFDWITHDKGYGRKLTEFGEIINPKGMQTIGDFPNLTAAMLKAGWSNTKTERIMGQNWVTILEEVWGK
ncbi:MAG: membrane dipeptidase [Candidatus Portiera sp.]|nr:membrane dipeptidase [Portiera sp.]